MATSYAAAWLNYALLNLVSELRDDDALLERHADSGAVWRMG